MIRSTLTGLFCIPDIPMHMIVAFVKPCVLVGLHLWSGCNLASEPGLVGRSCLGICQRNWGHAVYHDFVLQLYLKVHYALVEHTFWCEIEC